MKLDGNTRDIDCIYVQTLMIRYRPIPCVRGCIPYAQVYQMYQSEDSLPTLYARGIRVPRSMLLLNAFAVSQSATIESRDLRDKVYLCLMYQVDEDTLGRLKSTNSKQTAQPTLCPYANFVLYDDTRGLSHPHYLSITDIPLIWAKLVTQSQIQVTQPTHPPPARVKQR